MSGDRDKSARPTGAILGDDTPDVWDESSNPEGHTEFEFSPPSARAKEKKAEDDVEALLDKVIAEVEPKPDPVPDAYVTDELPKFPRVTGPSSDLATGRIDVVAERVEPRDPYRTAPVDVPKELGFQTTPLVDRPSASAPPRRPSVAVSRDTSTEMFDGEAASLDRLIKSSFDDPQSVPVPEALSDEARSVSKILRGRRDEIARVDTKSLTADLSLDPPSRVTPMPSGTGPISAPAGGDLDAVADAFDLDAEPSEDGALELAYDPRARRADTKPAARTSSAFLDDVTPDAFTSTTKILIAAVVAIVVVLLVVMLR